MTKARIYQPAKTAMQSGRAKTRNWVLEFEPTQQKQLDPLMGWTGSGDMTEQVRLRFADKDAAVSYAERHNIAYDVIEPRTRTPKRKSYADNFRATLPE